MRHYIHYITLLAASVALFAGCASKRQAGKTVRVTPAPYMLTPDSTNKVALDMFFHIPENYLSRRSRLVITPRLVVGDTVKEEYEPLVLDAPIYSKKISRRAVLDYYEDPYAGRVVKVDEISRSFRIPYKETVQLPEGTADGHLMAVVSVDGCGTCSGIDTIEVATILRPAMPVEEPLKLAWIEPEFVVRPKLVEGKGVAKLQFAINKSDIDLWMGANKAELDDMLHTLAPVLEDTLATLTSFTITGMASADGSLAFNTSLACARAASAKQWLAGQLDIRQEVQRLIAVDSRPEGWEPVLAAMVADGNPDAAAVREILQTYSDGNDDVQERYIRRLPCWNNIKTNYLQNDRQVEYAYAYTIRSFTTDSELLEMYRTRPDAFNEEELLQVAVLAPTPKEKQAVYQTILRYFPASQTAANNLAFLYQREGKRDEAIRVLEAAGLDKSGNKKQK